MFFSELPEVGIEAPLPPQIGASRLDALRELWEAAGLESIETRIIAVHRVFDSFDEFWADQYGDQPERNARGAGRGHGRRLKERIRSRLPADAERTHLLWRTGQRDYGKSAGITPELSCWRRGYHATTCSLDR